MNKYVFFNTTVIKNLNKYTIFVPKNYAYLIRGALYNPNFPLAKDALFR
jgi:hypothetical protein